MSDVLDRAVEEHQPTHVLALFSGGHDSLCATHIASQHPRFSGAVHVNTGIGIEATRDFVRETCRQQGWPLKEYHPPSFSYRDLALKYGFPGPAQHNVMYRYLKERALRQVVREHKTQRSDRVVFVNGIRQQESRRRMGTSQEVRRDGATVWVAPIFHWDARDRLPYMAAHGLPRNPVVDRLHISGECLCGCFAADGEFEMLEAWFPETARYIRALEDEVRAAGQPSIWGRRPPPRPPSEQTTLPFWDEIPISRSKRRTLCQDCMPFARKGA